MKAYLYLIVAVSFLMLKCKATKENKLLVPKQENQFVWVYKPAGDYFCGPHTEYLKEGAWYDNWVANDHTFVKAKDGRWHIFGITHPLVISKPLSKGIHDGEYASFHAVSARKKFSETVNEHHYIDLPKVLSPQKRKGEILANHAPFIFKKDSLYQMIYGHSPIRLAVSSNLNKWATKGNLFLKNDGDARDPNVLYHKGTYYMVYCSTKCVNMRKSKDFIHWSKPVCIFNTRAFDPESPSLIFHNNTFYLFVCSWDGLWDQKEISGAYQHKTYVLQSDDILNFGTDHEKQVTELNAHAPEIFQDEEGQWYISSAEWPKRGISVDKIFWK
nr:family 43 glycosylhydrolase [uncultured Marinifilum sp.]